jgi:hypothetical protein
LLCNMQLSCEYLKKLKRCLPANSNVQRVLHARHISVQGTYALAALAGPPLLKRLRRQPAVYADSASDENH